MRSAGHKLLAIPVIFCIADHSAKVDA